MIQRVQSVWLFLASLTLFLWLILPILTKQGTSGEIWFQISGLYQRSNNVNTRVDTYPLLFGGTILTGLVCLANIFNFRNRTLQKRIVLLTICAIVALVIGIGSYVTRIPGGIDGSTFNAGAYLPVPSILFCVLALRGIRKDEQLIRSADRLR
jgi:hypothetical protein